MLGIMWGWGRTQDSGGQMDGQYRVTRHFTDPGHPEGPSNQLSNGEKHGVGPMRAGRLLNQQGEDTSVNLREVTGHGWKGR